MKTSKILILTKYFIRYFHKQFFFCWRRKISKTKGEFNAENNKVETISASMPGLELSGIWNRNKSVEALADLTRAREYHE